MESGRLTCCEPSHGLLVVTTTPDISNLEVLGKFSLCTRCYVFFDSPLLGYQPSISIFVTG